jgi:TolA-binding protein
MNRQTISIITIFFISTALSSAKSDRQKMALMQQQLDQLSERVEGLTTVIEGLSNNISELKIAQSRRSPTAITIGKSRVDSNDQKFIKQDEKTTNREEKNHAVDGQTVDDREDIEGKNNSTLYREGAQFFQKQQYKRAENRFKLMIKKGYKKASSNYYLGEIAYYTKSYSDAVHYYKKSAKLYDKASYIDILLLHTAVSLEKRGDRVEAKLFYETVINDYPDKKSSKIARKNLEKLQ